MGKNNGTKIVILAAGKGVRMQSDLPKALMPLDGKPMLAHLLSAAEQVAETFIVINPEMEDLLKSHFPHLTSHFIIQRDQLGTAHALLGARVVLAEVEKVVVLYGDHPLVSAKTIQEILNKSETTGAEIVLASATVPNFKNENKIFRNFARLIRTSPPTPLLVKERGALSLSKGGVRCIREFKDASEEEKKITEMNPGYYVFRTDWLWPRLEKVRNDNAQGEYYLTDLIQMAAREGARIESVPIPAREAMGANSKEELEILERFLVE